MQTNFAHLDHRNTSKRFRLKVLWHHFTAFQRNKIATLEVEQFLRLKLLVLLSVATIRRQWIVARHRGL